jgi:hypothetical protein
MRCSFRTHLFSRVRFPGLAPWAGMRCPLQGKLQFPGRCPSGYALPRWGKLQFPGRCPGWYALPRWGKLNNGILIPRPCPNGHRVLTCRSGSVGANRPPRFRCHAPTGHRIPAQGANPGNPAGKRDPRSEGTPHSCVSRISAPAFLMRCSFRTHLFSRMRFPGRCPGWYALPRWGKLNNSISILCVSRISGCLTVLIGKLRPTRRRRSRGQKNVRPPGTADGLETTGR